MSEIHGVQKQLERALAFAHAALDEASDFRVARARYHAAAVLPKVTALPPRLALTEAHRLFQSVSQLRALMRVLDDVGRMPN
jgi:hypothetical protein